MAIGGLFALLSSIVGMLYGGFLIYQKVEELANLDITAFEQRMEVMETKMDEMVEYSRDIKNGLRDDILRIEQQVERIEDQSRNAEEKVRNMIDSADRRFEDKREQLRVSVTRDTKELEDRLNQKIQRALDNPLSNK
jgi:esterase/lipase